MDTRTANHSQADHERQTAEAPITRNEIGAQTDLQPTAHISLPRASSTAAHQSTSLQDSQHHMELGYSQVFGAAAPPTTSSMAEDSLMADKAFGKNDEIHGAYAYHKAAPDDKILTAQCIHCGQTLFKNVTRQRQHVLRGCPVLHPGQKNTASAQQRGQLQRTSNSLPDKVTDTLVSEFKQNTPAAAPAPGPSRVAGLPPPALMLAPSMPKTSGNGNGYGIPHDRVRVGSTPEIPAQRPFVSPGGDHPLSTYYGRPPQDHIKKLDPPASNMSLLAVGSRARPWMLHHEARAVDAFPRPSLTSNVIKTESELHDQNLRTSSENTHNLQSSRNATPLTSIEVEYDDEESDEDDSSGESDSGSESGSNEGSDKDSDSQ